MLLQIAWIERGSSQVWFDIIKGSQYVGHFQRNVVPVYDAIVLKRW
jgi:hypothetical protein